MGMQTIDQLEVECTLNASITAFNDVIEAFNEVSDPIEEAAEGSLKACKLDQTAATAKHCLMGVLLSMAADKNCSLDDLKAEITILTEKPFVQFGKRFEKWDGLVEHLPNWIIAYMEIPTKIPDIIEKIGDLPDKIQEGAEAAQSDFEAFSPLDKAKAIASAAKTASKLKSVLTSIKETVETFKTDAEDMKTALESVKAQLESGKLKEDGEVCNKAKLTEVKDCYEKIYGQIPAKKKGKAKGDGGCCTVF